VDEREWMADRFEEHRTHLRAVAYRMLGSLSEADDAVQEAWIRLSRADTGDVENLGGWLTTVVARVSLNMLRSRRSHPEQSLDVEASEQVPSELAEIDPEQEAVLADSVGLALLVVLDTLAPAERLAFVLHDMFAVPFDEIAPIVGRTPTAARQLASRARRRVQGRPARPDPDAHRQRAVVEAFLAASRGGDFEALVALLDPDVELHAGAPVSRIIRGAEPVAAQARLFSARMRFCEVALVNGAPGLIVAPRGRLLAAVTFTVEDGRIVEMEAFSEPSRLREVQLAVLGG
jgi:RNA polymerase sigma factor (sigma-70 family)